MKKKELEKKVADLEREISELKSQMLNLALSRQQQTIFFAPAMPAPHYEPYYPPHFPIITCSEVRPSRALPQVSSISVT